MRLSILMLMFIVTSFAALAANTADPSSLQPTGVIPYLERIVEWNRSVVSAEQLMDRPREAVLGDKLHQDAQTVLEKSFDYARVDASDPSSDQTADTHAQNGHAQLAKAVDDVNAQVTTLQSQLHQPGQSPQQSDQLAGELKLTEARQSLLQAMLTISNSEDEGTALDQINALSRTALAESPNHSKSPVSDALQTKMSPQSYSIIDLSKALLSDSQKQSTIATLLIRTKKIKETTHTLISAKRVELKDALDRGDALKASSGQAKDLATYQKSIDDLVSDYKKLSLAVIPLGESNASLENVIQNLEEWKKMTRESETRVSHQLLIRLLILAVSIAVPLICSSIARRAIFRLKDIQKRKQFDIARRILLIIALILVILVNFLTEFGSLATFAGFLTAGLAVGLQTVLVSMVAHSLYFGRFGIHIGDRIRVADVTGEVIQMGLLRLYMRELKETETGFVPTGKIVAFPNSILFQPSALYKYADEGDFQN